MVKSSLVARATRRGRDRTPFDQRMADALVAVCKGEAAGRQGRDPTASPAGRPGGRAPGATARPSSSTPT